MFTCTYCGRACKNRNSLAQHEIRCKANPNRINCVSGFKGKVSPNKGLTKETSPTVAKQAKSLKARYDSGQISSYYKGKTLSLEHKQKISQTHLTIDHDQVNKNSHGKRGWLDNIFFMSTWELAYYLFMRDHGKNIRRCSEKFSYTYNGKQHTYTPDFIIDEGIVEIKGYETDRDRLKYTLVPGLIIIDQSKIGPYLQYVKSHYKTDCLETLYEINLAK